MRLTDLLKISFSNLRRRKLRSFLTILGVVIGTSSIVMMISLGLGLQQSLYEDANQSGGLTNISVTGAAVGDNNNYFASSQEEESNKYISDKTVQELAKLNHVVLSSPFYQLNCVMLKGNYEGYVDLYGTTEEALKAKNLELAFGTLPPPSGRLSFVYGNGLLTNFTEKGSNKGFYETGTLPDIDLMKDTLFLVMDSASYSNSQEVTNNDTANESNQENVKKPVNKMAVKASGVIKGGINDYTSYYSSAFCNIDVLKKTLKTQFGNSIIPGQPTTKGGKPYKEFYYTGAEVKVDDTKNVDEVAKVIREMGYSASTNQEYLDSMKSQFVIIQAVLGGIGAVALLVAAIGIANTMMMSVYERTKEIGIMKVLGCSLKNIKRMFLYEAAGVGIIGGFLGCFLSYLLSFGMNKIAASVKGIDTMRISYIPVWLALVAMGFSMIVGIIAGLLPALRAMKLSPLAAIRSE